MYARSLSADLPAAAGRGAFADLDGLAPRMRDARTRRRVPLPAPLVAVEWTQAIQFCRLAGVGLDRPANSVPLVAGKPLYARIYVSADGQRWPGAVVHDRVSAEVVLPSGRFRSDEVITRDAASRGRHDARGSLNVAIPAAECRGRLDVTVRVLAKRRPVGGEQVVAEWASHLDFVEVPRLPVLVAPIALEVHKGLRATPLPEPDITSCAALLHEASRPLPTPGFDVRMTAPPALIPCRLEDGLADVRKNLLKLHVATTRDVVVVGVFSREFAAMGPPAIGRGGDGVVVVPEDRAGTACHELGHVLMRRHSPCGQCEGVDADFPDEWPLPTGSIGDCGFRVAGSDTAASVAFEVLKPDTYLDYMGGGQCTPAWTSAHGWTQALRALRRRTWRRRCRQGEFLLLHLELAGKRARLGHSYHLQMRPPEPLGEPSPFSVDLLDEAGRPIARHRLHELDLGRPEDAPADHRVFVEAVPWLSAARGLAVRRDGELIDCLDLPDAPPQLEDVGLEGVAVRDAGVRVKWTVRDRADAPALVRYSNDDGQTWYALAADVTAGGVDLDLRGVPGGERCVIEVATTSGARTTVRRTTRFALPPASLTVRIVRPRQDDELHPEELVELVGTAYSPDLPPVEDTSLRWVARSGAEERELGRGGSLVTRASELFTGPNDIHLSLVGGPADASDLITVTVVPRGESVRREVARGRMPTLD